MSGTETDDPGQGSASPPCLLGEMVPGVPDDSLMDAQDVARWRRAERERLRAERLSLPAEVRTVIATALAGHLTTFLAGHLGALTGRIVSGYWPIKGELDLRGWLAGLHEQGAIIVLPVVETQRAPLVYRRWQPGMRMERGHWGIPVPPAESERLTPQVSLAPLVGWDAKGYRLGYGGGYFDRTLASLDPRPFVIGVGLQAARVNTIVPQPHDIPMSIIVTEAGVQVKGVGGAG